MSAEKHGEGKFTVAKKHNYVKEYKMFKATNGSWVFINKDNQQFVRLEDGSFEAKSVLTSIPNNASAVNFAGENYYPTCTKGYGYRKICEWCNVTTKYEIFYDDEVGEHSYVWKTEVVATCIKEGKEIEYCSVCGTETGNSRSIAMIAHSWEGWKTKQAQSCTNDEIKSRKCTVCSKSEEQYTENKALGHNIDTTKEPTKYIAPTCTENEKAVYYCDRCKTDVHVDTGSGAGHSWGVEDDGNTHECSVCNTSHKRNPDDGGQCAICGQWW